jgi:diketogulonate reductase-like aldo/keto reductase
MKTKKIGDFEIPVLGIGTFGMGGEHEPDYSNDDACIKAIKEAIKLGYGYIDTAEIYSGGHAEELIGKAIKGIDRKKLFIVTKVFSNHLRYDDVINSAKNSLKRLGTDYIDLYLIHSPNPDIPLKETMKAMDYLADKKMIRFIGVSNFNIGQLKDAQKYSKHKIVVNDLKYHLWAKDIDKKTVEYCQNNNIIVIAHKPFGRGLISEQKIPVLDELAKKYKKTEAQIILSWLISKKNFVTVFKSTNPKHLKENLESLNFHLSEDDIKRLDAIINSTKQS